MNNKGGVDYTLYLVTDSTLLKAASMEEAVEKGIKGGCTLVQLREKDMCSLDFYHMALRVKQITTRYQVPLIINDRADIALAVDAEGLHVGQTDLPGAVARQIIGGHKILGVSAATREEALEAQRIGADYLGVGAVFTTGTKTDARPVTIESLGAIKKSVEIPVVAIGGINEKTIPLLAGTEIDGVAAVSAIVGKDDITKSAADLKALFQKVVGHVGS